jgi:hypothetical protein
MTKSDNEEIIKWIESQPELDYLRISANKTLCEYRLDEVELTDRIIVNTREDLALGRETFIQKIKNVFWVPGKNLRGNQVASKELDNSLNTTSKVMSVSTIWDFVCTWPIFSYVLGKLSWASGPAGFALGFLILWASNITGENSTNRTSNNVNKARVSLIAFLILSLAKTAVSGVGIDMIISKGRIIEGFAEEELLKRQDKENAIVNSAMTKGIEDSPESDELKFYRNQCQQLMNDMARLDLDKGRQRKLYKEIKFQAEKAENAPCPKVAQLERTISQDKSSQLNEINIEKKNTQQRILDKSNMTNIEYLAKYYQPIYRSFFIGRPSDRWVWEGIEGSSTMSNKPIEWKNDRKGDAVEASMKQFFGKLQNGELASLGFSIFAFVISIILTSTAAILLYSTGKNPDVKASFTASLAKKSNALMNMFRKDLEN